MADVSILAPQQHRQPSRKGKKAWRKNVDITEVQEGLDEVREELIKHGGVLAERASSDLFVTDVAGSKDIQKAYTRANKLLKADEILSQRSAVPLIGTHKRSAGLRTTDGSLEPSMKRRRDYVSGKDYERLRRVAYGGAAVDKDIVEQGGDASYDPWASAEPAPPQQFSFLERKRATREPRTLKEAPVSLAKGGKTLSAVRKPEGGKSYNPLFEDWEAVIQREGEKALAEERQRLEDEQQEQEKQAMIEKAQAEEDREQSEWESEWEGILSEKEDAEQDKEWLRKKRPERKTPAERNKIKRRKQEERRKIHEEKMRTREQDLANMKALIKGSQKLTALVEQQTGAGSEDWSSSEAEEIELRRRIPKHVPEAPLEVVLADELEDSLRRLRPEGNLLQDRYRSMILRGKIESRAKITQPKKPKREVTEKWGYKDWKLR